MDLDGYHFCTKLVSSASGYRFTMSDDHAKRQEKLMEYRLIRGRQSFIVRYFHI
jgi:hypothetical protein